MQTKQDKVESRKYYARFFISFLFIFAMILVFIGIELYRRTVISPFILVVVVALGAFLGFFLLYSQSLLVMNKFWATFNCCATGGGIFYYFVLFFNSHFANSILTTADLEIVEFGTLASGRKSSCRQPYFVVDFNGTEKQLVFKCNLEHPLEDYTRVHVVYQKGLFGFNYVVKKHPKVN